MNPEKLEGSIKIIPILVVALMMPIALMLIGCSSEKGIEGSTATNVSRPLNSGVESYKECVSDKDCVHIPVCCHRNAMQCVPKYKVNENTLNNCKDVFCTMECRECTTCKCVNNKCISEPIEGSCC